MSGDTWIVTYGCHVITPHHPAVLPRITDPPLRYAPQLMDNLAWGPQHVDLGTQTLMRRCYDRTTDDDLPRVDQYLDLLAAGQRLVFWGQRELSGCLAILWALDALHSRGADLGRCVLALDPRWRWENATTPEEMGQRVRDGLPIAEVLPDLIAVRRHLASDSDTIVADLFALPEPVRQWCAVTDRLADLLPDDRGLDWFDSLLIDALTVDWQQAAKVIGPAIRRQDEAFSFGDGRLFWDRLFDLSDKSTVMFGPADPQENALCQLEIDGPAAIRFTRARITARGKGVRDARTDLIKHRHFFRWVGGRLLTNERVLRRPGNYHKGTVAPPR